MGQHTESLNVMLLKSGLMRSQNVEVNDSYSLQVVSEYMVCSIAKDLGHFLLTHSHYVQITFVACQEPCLEGA